MTLKRVQDELPPHTLHLEWSQFRNEAIREEMIEFTRSHFNEAAAPEVTEVYLPDIGITARVPVISLKNDTDMLVFKMKFDVFAR